jgi:hypothetical protein
MAHMSKIQVWAWAAALLLGLSLAGPAVRSAEQETEVPREKVYRHTAHSFVIINYHLKKSDRPGISDEDRYRYGQTPVLQRILNKNTLDVVGVIISDKGEVFTFEKDLPSADVISKITVTGPDGVVVPAEADRLLAKAPGQVVCIVGELPAAWRPLEFVELGEVGLDTKLYAATMKPDEQRRIYVAPCGYGLNWNEASEYSHCLSVPGVRCVGVICNGQGQPVGVTSQDQIDLGPTDPIWRGKDILADAGISTAEQKQLEEKLEQDFAKHIYEVTITFRPEPKEEEEYDFGGRFPFAGRLSGRSNGRDQLVYGLGFAEGKVLVPDALPQETVAGIDTITIKVDDKQVPARFGGVLKECSAMVIELQQGTLPRVATFPADGTVARTEPFWAVFVRELAGMDVLVQYSRWVNKTQGYADKWYPVAERSLRSGSWLLDRQGKLVGFYGRARHEHDRLAPYLLGDRYGRVYSMGSTEWMEPMSLQENRRLFEAAELAQMLDNLPANYDRHIRHLSKDEQKRRVWLGVEYTRLSKEMVKQMGVRSQTKDGRIGLMINRVYAGSPAARLGLVEGDVLLKITVPEAPWPIELTPGERESFDVPDFDEEDIPKEFEAMGLRMPRGRPWPSRENSLTRMLADIGAGTSVKLNYIHAGQTTEEEFVIEQAPRDMLSAAKYKSEKLGLTVKDLTYEVRAALRLREDEAGVIVSQIEQGTPAAMARINAYELIRAVDGVQVENVEAFERLITEAQQANKTSVRLTVEWMGKTRLADLNFEAKGASGMLKSLIPGL